MVDFVKNIIIIRKKEIVMGTRLNGTSLFTGIYSGLTSTYSVLANENAEGVTLESISAARSNSGLTSSLNQNFASYLQTNFSSLDKDTNGILSATELNEFTNQMSTQGMTQAQLMQLGAASGLSTSTLEQVLNHFSEVDANKDGKVTTAEISAYGINSEAEKKKTEYRNQAATNMSTFYGSESTTADSSSMLDYKYLSDDENV